MKKLILYLLTLTLLLSLVSCGKKSGEKEISCEDIIKAYKDAGYYVIHGEHKSEENGSQKCYIKVNVSEDEDSDYIYFTTFYSYADAEAFAKDEKYNLVLWAYSAIMGESRWLKTGSYGEIEYSYYNKELIKPFLELIK